MVEEDRSQGKIVRREHEDVRKVLDWRTTVKHILHTSNRNKPNYIKTSV